MCFIKERKFITQQIWFILHLKILAIFKMLRLNWPNSFFKVKNQ